MSLLLNLRSATQQCHRQLESHLGLPATVKEHIARLEQFYTFHRAWEPMIAPHIGHLPLGSRDRLHLLESDLRHFGMTTSQLAELPICNDLPPIDDMPSALGSQYVMEGSTLGGQLIARHLESTLQLKDRLGYSYYLPYEPAPGTGAMWQSFKSILESQSAPATDPLIISAAIATFECLDRLFQDGC